MGSTPESHRPTPGSSARSAPSLDARRRHISDLLASGRTADALSACEAAIDAMPEVAGFRLFKALCLLNLRRYGEAVRAIDFLVAAGQALSGPALSIKAQALWCAGREDEAVETLKTATSLRPHDSQAREMLGKYCLALGQFDIGWREHEHRLARLPPARTDIGRWTGENLEGKRLLVVSEQGLGDTLQFVRFLPLLRERGALLTAMVQPAILDLLKSSDAEVTWTSDLRTPEAFDFRIDLLSLPLMFGTRLETIPQRVPYLRADPGKVASWAGVLGPHGHKVGIAWQGSIGPMRDDERSIPPSLFQAVGEIPGVRLVSLQGITGLEALAELPPGMVVERLGEKIESNPQGISEIAAVMENVDLIITSDTVTAHLAGALARPVWVALKRHGDWRWLQRRTDSPWYPTMRLFRQETEGDWTPVVTAMAERLREKRTQQTGPAN